MKKISLLVLSGVLLCSAPLSAQDGAELGGAKPASAGTAFVRDASAAETQGAPARVSDASRSAGGDLIDLGSDRLGNRLDDLERRLAGLERNQRSQDGTIRQMSRDIDDLKRGIQDFRTTYR
jgi:hypothetical protein